ncbi:PKD domain-containing protein, partial [Paenibacillus abyssi]|uniref:PKD domain-containing protein n=2 Tax=Paenibacillus abyssi TaxID=1340531 RepID=UPI0016631D9C
GFEWGDWSAAKFFYIETNRPPIADFNWAPQTVYEGDGLQFINKAQDPDGDALTYLWSITAPNSQVTASTLYQPVLNKVSPGVYKVQLSVSDGKETDSIAKDITVLPLTLEAQVNHTSQWLSIHEDAGHETVNAPKDFYAGEVFVLTALTSSAPVQRVTAILDTTGLNGRKLSTSTPLLASEANRYYSEFHDERWASLTEGLPKGMHMIRFTVEYKNGTVKTVDVPIQIIGSTFEIVRIHRRR